MAASAVSGSDIWAVGVTEHHGTLSSFVEHYNGTAWRRAPASSAVRNPSAVLALSGNDVWVVGSRSGGKPTLARWHSGRWQAEPAPFSGLVEQVISDGSGGLWLTSFGSTPSSASLVWHRSRDGKWTRTDITSAPGGSLSGLGLILGTTSVLGVGSVGSDAAIYAHGSV